MKEIFVTHAGFLAPAKRERPSTDSSTVRFCPRLIENVLLCVVAVLLFGSVSASGRPPRSDSGRKGSAKTESMSFIILGDVHYCDPSCYDLTSMLAEKPSDHRQITKSYAPVTAANWADQIGSLKERIASTLPPVGCVVQLGDISEGIANSRGMADRMADNMMEVLRQTKLGVPWLLVKGNHDVTGFGSYRQEAREAFGKYYVPFIREQIGSDEVREGNYTFRTGEMLFVMLDAYNNSVDQTAFAKEALENSTAKYKFVCMHEPAIPATERCWHYLRSKPAAERDEFLKVLAQNKAIFLCGHLHRYSVLRRDTEWGPIVQVMATSVTNLRRSAKPTYRMETRDYGESLVDWKADWNPSTAEQRKAVLREEARHVNYYKMNNLAGYGVISIDAKKERVTLRYYPAFGDDPCDETDLTALYNLQ